MHTSRSPSCGCAYVDRRRLTSGSAVQTSAQNRLSFIHHLTLQTRRTFQRFCYPLRSRHGRGAVWVLRLLDADSRLAWAVQPPHARPTLAGGLQIVPQTMHTHTFGTHGSDLVHGLLTGHRIGCAGTKGKKTSNKPSIWMSCLKVFSTRIFAQVLTHPPHSASATKDKGTGDRRENAVDPLETGNWISDLTCQN